MVDEDLSWIDEDVCVGSGGQAILFGNLKKKGVGLIVNLERTYHLQEEKAAQINRLRYFYLPVRDLSTPKQDQLDAVVAEMRKAVDAGMKVFIHCGAGQGRSPTFAAAYLISRGMKMEDAIKLIKNKRPQVWKYPLDQGGPNKALPEYERRKNSGSIWSI